ncbi:calcyphosin-like protein [Folsomia candida]|uniref:Calcyphosin-like protein n=1 Tax=Folsomia candida TaxID=158441 RepID=A0A226DN26_FOLCA|nr:calcyphosin-like protein [Folsomia candida]OXA46942.1 Calcyphosin-like protein [Folsomia candida]
MVTLSPRVFSSSDSATMFYGRRAYSSNSYFKSRMSTSCSADNVSECIVHPISTTLVESSLHKMQRPRTSMTRNEDEMMSKARMDLLNAKDPVEKLRLLCLIRGSNGILAMGKIFRRLDDDGNRSLNFEEFSEGMNDTGMKMNAQEKKKLFDIFDRDQSGSISINEFLLTLRPPLNSNRRKMIELAFRKLDKSGDGVVTIDDLKNVYSVRTNPRYLSGEETEAQILGRFLRVFEESGTVDGKVTFDEFVDYYAGVSSSIDNDGYFDLMMRNAWKL